MVSKENFAQYISNKVKRLRKDILTQMENVFTHVALKLLYGFSDDKAVRFSIIAGPGDKKIDAFWYDEQNNEIYIVQSKYRISNIEKKYNEDSISEVKSGYENLIYTKPTSLNDEIRELQGILKEAIERCAHVNLISIVFGEITKSAKDKIKSINQSFEKEKKDVNLDVITMEKIIERYENDILESKDFPSDIITTSEAFIFEMGDKKTVVGIIPIKITGDWYKKFGSKLFQKNVRENLTNKNPVNEKIEKTLRSRISRPNFLYYNNGLTITCDTLSYDSEKKKIELKNFQVVNGCQTVCAIERAMQFDDDIDASILIRITETKDESFQNDITLYTNTQTAVYLEIYD